MSDRSKAGGRPRFFKRSELIIAEKEFRDHVTSKRFIVVFGIMLLLGIYAINSGMDYYNQQLDQYKNPQISSDSQWKQERIDSLQKQLQNARDQNRSADYIQSTQYQLDALVNPAMPSILKIFESMVALFTYLGMVLGASLGFDQIAREKDEGSLKFLVTSPIYRDAIINGKTIGAIAALAGAMAAAFAITVAIMLLKGVVPGAEDLIRITLLFAGSLLYCAVFFSLAMMVSALSKNTAVAAIMTVGLVFAVFIYTMLAGFSAYFIASSIVGQPPVPGNSYDMPTAESSAMENGTAIYPYQPFNDELDSYYTRLYTTQGQVSDFLGILSPLNNYAANPYYGHGGIGFALITNEETSSNEFLINWPTTYNPPKKISLLDSLASIWLKVLAIIFEIAIAFGITYVVFMRTDVR